MVNMQSKDSLPQYWQSNGNCQTCGAREGAPLDGAHIAGLSQLADGANEEMLERRA